MIILYLIIFIYTIFDKKNWIKFKLLNKSIFNLLNKILYFYLNI